jgi:hypothetical protein
MAELRPKNKHKVFAAKGDKDKAREAARKDGWTL